MQPTAAFAVLCIAVSSAAQPVATLGVPGATPGIRTISASVLNSLAISEPDIFVPAEVDSSAPMNLVGIKLVISREGDVRSAVTFAGTPDLRQVALAGVRDWKFRPYLLNGEPQEVQSMLFVTFSGGVGKPLGAPPPPAAPFSLVIGGIAAAAPGTQVPVAAMPQARVAVSSDTAARLLVAKVDPAYPPLARAANVQGTVILQASISKEGTVEKLEIISGPPTLTQAAIDAVQRWRYKPYLLKNEPVEVDTTINVNFTLDAPLASAVTSDTDTPVHLSPQTITEMLADSPMPNCSIPAGAPAPAVALHVVIAKDGSVKDAQLTSGPPELQACTLEAVRRWRYRPVVSNGAAREAEGTVSMHILPGGE